jgi:hypothetical protein
MTQPIEIQKEATFLYTGRAKATTCPVSYFDFTGCTISGYLTKDLKSGARIPLTASFTDAANGVLEFSLTDNQVVALEFVAYKLRLIIEFPSGNTHVVTEDARVLP